MNTYPKPDHPAWMKHWLLAAALYNVIWGGLVVLFPLLWFQWFGMEPPTYPELWQCIGMIVGVYGVGYFVAAFDPYRHWPIVLVGLMGKVFGPLGFGWALIQGTFPLRFGLNILTNDLIWWIPFTGILLGTYKHWQAQAQHAVEEAKGRQAEILSAACTEEGQSLIELSQQHRLLLVFLRHSGCTFCREMVDEIAKHRTKLEEAGLHPVVIHMSPPPLGRAWLDEAGLQGVPHISNPDQTLYRAVGLGQGSLQQLFGLNVWIRGVQAALFGGYGVGKLDGNGFQLSGHAILYKGQLKEVRVHEDAAESIPFNTLVQPT